MDWSPILGLIADGIIGYDNFTVVLGPHSKFQSLLLFKCFRNSFWTLSVQLKLCFCGMYGKCLFFLILLAPFLSLILVDPTLLSNPPFLNIDLYFRSLVISIHFSIPILSYSLKQFENTVAVEQSFSVLCSLFVLFCSTTNSSPVHLVKIIVSCMHFKGWWRNWQNWGNNASCRGRRYVIFYWLT